jgi:hypothetical protein
VQIVEQGPPNAGLDFGQMDANMQPSTLHPAYPVPNEAISSLPSFRREQGVPEVPASGAKQLDDIYLEEDVIQALFDLYEP